MQQVRLLGMQAAQAELVAGQQQVAETAEKLAQAQADHATAVASAKEQLNMLEAAVAEVSFPCAVVSHFKVYSLVGSCRRLCCCWLRRMQSLAMLTAAAALGLYHDSSVPL